MGTATTTTKAAKPQEYNPRWKGYGYIILLSLVNFASVSNLDVNDNAHFEGGRQFSVSFGAVTFVASFVILVQDRCQYCCTKADDSGGGGEGGRLSYTKSMEGRIEGCTLFLLTIWWIIGYVNKYIIILYLQYCARSQVVSNIVLF